ncbi:flagellar filament capping protein FliD [Paenibacillus gorillae]|uniref:flagellar filament capping protein FliD n=1 Tax=Paenibacillus gorillae TaxID=1243662 RepID=UPI0004B67763|nr:flagellar filament capping protein FliD [Paenibacillus gorillae]
MRLSGFASGLDIDAMVKELMKAKRSSYDNMVKNRTKVEWQQEDYRSMSSKIVDFRNNKLSSFNLSKAIGAKTSEVSGDTTALTVNSTNSNASGTLNVKVDQVATAANSIYKFTNKFADNTEKKLSDLGFTEIGATGNVSININNVDITVSKDATLSELATAINAKSGTANATALYDAKSGQFSITATKTGLTDASKWTGITVANMPTMDNANNNIQVNDTNKGANAIISINGIEHEQASNRFAVNGFDFTVKTKTAANSVTTIAAVKDTETIVKTIQSFVSEYNSLISSINSELSETKNRSYKPLTADEKKEMSDKEVELWEEKARSGALRSDSTLTKLVTELRAATNALVGGIKDASGQNIPLGITTGSYTEKGKLVLNEDQLRSALESNPEAITNLFSNSTTGVFNKMTKSAMTALDSLSKRAGTSLTSTDTNASFLENSLLSGQIKQMKERESLMLRRLDMMEKQYYKQFSGMETAINKFNSQSSSLNSLSS